MRLRKSSDSGVKLDMTPMIDVVFQLLAFFLMSFRVFAPEGDFDVRMPLVQTGRPSDVVPEPALHVRLSAAPGGRLAGIAVNGRPVENFDALQARVIELVGDDRGPTSVAETTEVVLDCDAELAYSHTIDAVTAVSGHTGAGGRPVKLLDKIRFAPPRT